MIGNFDENIQIVDEAESTLYIFYKYLGLNPWVILALADNQYAKTKINEYIKE